jgi:hypothetical protein
LDADAAAHIGFGAGNEIGGSAHEKYVVFVSSIVMFVRMEFAGSTRSSTQPQREVNDMGR